MLIQAVAFHDILQKKRHSKNLSKLSFSEHPLLIILIVCDILEVWDRNTGYETIYDNIPIESIELNNIDISEETLILSVNYRLHNQISYTDSTLDRERKKLKTIIEDKVEDILNLIPDDFPKINVSYFLSGRKEIISIKT